VHLIVHYVNKQGETLLEDYEEDFDIGTVWWVKVPTIKYYKYISRLEPFYILMDDTELTLVYDKYENIKIPLYMLGDYATALGLELPINHCGDCFD
jgi:hypothetical protein